MSDPDHDARPATFRGLIGNGEYRSVFLAGSLSAVGDAMARAAVTALVYQHTHSVFTSGATFAISYLPWIGFGSVLAAIAERYPFKRTMIVCDLAQMTAIGAVALLRLPVYATVALLFVAAIFTPPFLAARSALLPRILQGDQYVLSLSVAQTYTQAALIFGYFAGGTVAGFNPRLALLADAATFALSASLVGLGVRRRGPGLRPERRRSLLRETGEGFEVVFGSPVLRSIAVVIFASLMFPVVPEGFAAAWAARLTGNGNDRGWVQGVIMCAMPLGVTLGSVVISRYVRPSLRQRLIRPFAVVCALALVPAMLNPPVYGVAALAAVSGFAVGGLVPAANGLFVQALPNEVRARAFGVMQTGVQLSQGLAIVVTGALAASRELPTVVGLWGVFGVALMTVAALAWPRPAAVTAEVARVQEANARAEAIEAATPGRVPDLEGPTVELSLRGMRTVEIPAGFGAAPGVRRPRPHDPGGRHRIRSTNP